MNNYDDYENELDAIRIRLYEQTKDMTSEEHTSFFNNKAQAIADKYGFKLIKDVSEAEYPCLTKHNVQKVVKHA